MRNISLTVHAASAVLLTIHLLLPHDLLGAEGVPWRSLRFEGRGIFASARSEINIIPCDGTLTGRSARFEPGLSGLLPRRAHCKNLTVLVAETSVSGLLIPDIQYERAVWFQPATLEAVCRVRWNRNRPETVKFYRWKNDGVTRWKLTYNESTESLREVNRSFYSYGQRGADCGLVSEPVLLLYLVSLPDFMASEEDHEVCVFGKKKLHQIIIRKKPYPKNRDMEYANNHDSLNSVDKDCLMERSGRGENRGSCPEPDTLYMISDDSDNKKEGGVEKFSLLGLSGDIRIAVSRKSGLPLKISGNNENAGTVILKLKRAVIR